MSSITSESFANRTVELESINISKIFWAMMKGLGSLRIAVFMFAMGTLLLLVGTLAQDQDTIVDVKNKYFNSWIAYVPFDVFVPITIYPHKEPYKFGFYMPGGALIGLTLLVNLFAAKLTRFSIHASGARLVAGLIVTSIGCLMIALVILSAHLGDGLQGEPPFSYDHIWTGTKASVYILTLLLTGWLVFMRPKNKIIFRTGLAIGLIMVGLCTLLSISGDSYRIPDPGLRVVWQLTKSLGVGLVLLIGLTILFGQRGGNVLIHLGVGLLMVGQFLFGDTQREERMVIYEGQKTCVAAEIDTVEFVIIDNSPEDGDRVIAFNQDMLIDAQKRNEPLTVDGLPFSIQIDKWMVNSAVRQRRTPDETPGYKGLIKEWQIEEAPRKGGAVSGSNVASVFYTVLSKPDKKNLGQYAASQWINDEHVVGLKQLDTIEHASKKYEVGLQFRRNYKNYSVTAKDVVLEEYTNTGIPKDYSSWIDIRDKEGNLIQDGRIWMNSPMRFRGETFYQSSYQSREQTAYGVEQTVLQVVTNAGWLIPYVSCVLVGLGMLFHFSGTFARFAMRYERGAIAIPHLTFQPAQLSSSPAIPVSKNVEKSSRSIATWICGAVSFLAVAAYFLSLFLPPKASRDKIDYQEIATIPVHYGGRVKPLASAGAEILQTLSSKPYALIVEDAGKGEKPIGRVIPPEQWLFSVMMEDEWVLTNPLIRIDAESATKALGLKRVPSNRYSCLDIDAGFQQMEPARLRKIIEDSENREKVVDFDDRKLLEVLDKLSLVRSIINAYRVFDLERVRVGDLQTFQRELREEKSRIDRIRGSKPPCILPSFTQETVAEGEKAPPLRWDAMGPLYFDALPKILTQDESPNWLAFNAFRNLKNDYHKSKRPSVINEGVKQFREAALAAHGENILNTETVRFEHRFSSMNLFAKCQGLYVVMGLIGFLSFVFAPRPLRAVALCLCLGTFLMHTYGIWARIEISGRPPVVSLYSAAIFIGWGMVLACVILEFFYPIRILLIIASVSGYMSLLVAYKLSSGDSTPVLQAVLDTQFWLATHVLSVTLGYSATFLAGLLGIAIVIFYAVAAIRRSTVGTTSTKSESEKELKDTTQLLFRVCYAIVCFGIFFSFVGTVLGGLWGDDSWGRFWGWDPKENGALMIVLWNALLLHARWDKLVGPLGFANLAIFGNVITAWSMFGTNQLGIGLHAYGGFEGQILISLAVWGVVQLFFMGIGIYLSLAKKQEVALVRP